MFKYIYKVVDVNMTLATVTVDIKMPDGAVDSAVFSTRSICNSDSATAIEILTALDAVVESYVYATYPPPPPRPDSLNLILNKERTVML